MSTELQQREAAIARLKNKRGFWQSLVAFFVINGFLIAIWALAGGGYFWPAWVMAAWAIGLIFHGYNAFFQKPITEEEIEQEMRRGGDVAA